VRRLGAIHYHRDVTDAMYPVVGEILCETLKWAEGKEVWAGVSADWAEAYGIVAGAMMDGAAEEAKLGPPTWPASVVSVTRPEGCPDVAVLTVGTEPEVAWWPGAWLELETPGLPRVWWKGCPANLPDGRGVIEFHVRAAGRGGASDALACLEPEAPLRIGMTGGRFALDTASRRDIVMAADSTGVAPLLALLGEITTFQAPPAVTLFCGAASARGLYALDGLREFATGHPWLAVVPVAYDTDGPLHRVITGGVDWSGRDAYLVGPAAVTAACREALTAAGMPPERIRARSFGRAAP
jgi:NAD(P)H-flavin reductase